MNKLEERLLKGKIKELDNIIDDLDRWRTNSVDVGTVADTVVQEVRNKLVELLNELESQLPIE